MKLHRHWLVLLLCCLTLAACQKPSSDDSVEAAPSAAESAAMTTAEECVIDPPTEPVACTMQYDPVCGCDGKTYSNGCAAGAAGVPSSTPGACPDEGAGQ